MKYQYYTCDVFSETRFGGNPLAVFPEAEGLSPEQMQQIAREFNYSESTFVFPPSQGQTRHVRIFTPTREVPFAGHPNIGTAFVLASMGAFGPLDERHQVVFEEAAGLVPITIEHPPEQPMQCELKAPEPVSIGPQVPVELVAAALSLADEDIQTAHHLPQVASVGLPFVIVELKDLASLERAQANVTVMRELQAMDIPPDIHLYVHREGDFDLHTRMFAPLDNVPEDPATGSANGALVGMLTQLSAREAGTFQWTIAQGIEMGRPSVLKARTEKRDGVVTGVWIGGACVIVCEGTIQL